MTEYGVMINEQLIKHKQYIEGDKPLHILKSLINKGIVQYIIGMNPKIKLHRCGNLLKTAVNTKNLNQRQRKSYQSSQEKVNDYENTCTETAEDD